MTPDVVFSLIDRIYEAAVHPDRWQDFVEGLSQALGGATGAMALLRPRSPQPARHYPVDMRIDLEPVFERHLARGMPWGHAEESPFRERFGRISDFYPDAELARSDFYAEWMEPHGLAPEGPVGHVICDERDWPMAGLGFFRKVGGRRFTEDHMRLGNLLVPHLTRAVELYRRFGGARHENLALAEVMNRLPLGVMLIDRDRRRVVGNRSADRLIALNDGFYISDAGLCATNPRDDGVLQGLLDDAIAKTGDGSASDRVMAVSRPSGKPAFPVIVSPLLEGDTGGAAEGAVACVLFGDPDEGQAITPEILRTTYRLTPAEADLVNLLAGGCCLEDAAKQRGVTLSTVRSQLKRVFAKTETKHQGGLVRLVLTGAATFEKE
jgi:DNA-binding CsgD family transcriptional regulator